MPANSCCIYGLPTGADRVRSSFSTIVGSGHSLLPKMPARVLCRHRLSSSILQLCSIHALRHHAPLSMMAGLSPVAVRHYTVRRKISASGIEPYLASIVDRSLRQGFMGRSGGDKPDKDNKYLCYVIFSNRKIINNIESVTYDVNSISVKIRILAVLLTLESGAKWPYGIESSGYCYPSL